MKKAIVIGSGAGGATVARELQGRFAVTILEAGGHFKPFGIRLTSLEKLRITGLFFDEREIQLLFPAMRVRKTADRMVMVNGMGTGGTTTICTGNALRMDNDLKAIGIDLDNEFAFVSRDIPISFAHRQRWKQSTKLLFDICEDMGLQPQPAAKMGDYERCRSCGRCVLGCPEGVRWDARRFLNEAVANGAALIMNCTAKHLAIENGNAVSVIAQKGLSEIRLDADLIIIAAGGFGTPVILQSSGIACQSTLFVDPVLCVATSWPNALQNKEIAMPFIVQQPYYIISPYFDWLSFFFNRDWRIPSKNILSLMIKLADENTGSVSGKRIHKTLTVQDKQHLQNGVALCTDIFTRLGVDKNRLFLGTINAGHPGGMLPLTANEADTLHPPVLPANVYVADATLFPKALGNPPILTIIALAKRVSKVIKELYT